MQFLEDFDKQILPENHHTYNRVARIVTRILKSNDSIESIKKKNWTITVIDQADKNAFVLPVIIEYNFYSGHYEL